MANDPAFLFYPGDYLRDTQTLSSNSQVAYDRIMCEHMRNICISKQQLKFFTKRLNPDELEEIMFVLTEVKGGFQIEWVAESIVKRRAYSESRRNNRKGKKEKTKKDILTYDEHMENEIEDKNVNRVLNVNEDKDYLLLATEFNNEQWKEMLCMNYSITLVDMDNYIKEFLTDRQSDESYKEKSTQELKNWFVNIIRKKKETPKDSKQTIKELATEILRKDGKLD